MNEYTVIAVLDDEFELQLVCVVEALADGIVPVALHHLATGYYVAEVAAENTAIAAVKGMRELEHLRA